MNFKLFLSILPFAISAFAQTAPDGSEWQSPQNLSLGKLHPRADFWPFRSATNAKNVLPENSSLVTSLDGSWKFNWVESPDKRPLNFYQPDFDDSNWDNIAVPSNWNVAGLGNHGSQKYGKPIYVNQKVIFYHKVEPNDWKNGVMREPPVKWTTYKFRNEVGSYRRSFNIPESWNGNEIYLQFDGVDSFFYLWINGEYVGFSKNSRNAARFDITPYIRKGDNILAVEVYRNSDGSFLEAQDMFRLPGIFRSVWLYSTPKIQIANFQVIPDLNNNYKEGSLKISSTIANLSKKNINNLKIVYSLFPLPLYSDKPADNPVARINVAVKKLQKQESETTTGSLTLNQPQLWSAEEPNRYLLLAELFDNKGNLIEATSTYTGFRKVEIRDIKPEEDEFGQGGRGFFVNGKAIKLRGVNRHETDPFAGHAISRDKMLVDLNLIKRANINHVRNSHYPPAPYWYYLCDKYGIYLNDEANIESHEYYYGDASLSHPKEWESAHVERIREMAMSNINHPSIVIWSLGNEAGPGKNFKAASDWLKSYDITRPIHYERNNEVGDMGSCMYPSIDWTQKAARGEENEKFPFYICEYAHSMGNAVGNLVDYWNAIDSSNRIFGASIWDWVDQGIYNTDSLTNKQYIAYGGDFGDYPNDESFVLNGIVFSDMTPKPQYYEVKKVYQPYAISAVEGNKKAIEVFNKNFFMPTKDVNLTWKLMEDGKEVERGQMPGSIAGIQPRQKRTMLLPISTVFNPQKEYFINISIITTNTLPWANKGYQVASEQIALSSDFKPYAAPELISTKSNLILKTDKEKHTVSGDNFTLEFDNKRATICKLKFADNDMILDGNGPKLSVYRALVDNDNWFIKSVKEKGLDMMKDSVINYSAKKLKNGDIIISYKVISSGNDTTSFKIESLRKWTVKSNGTINFEGDFISTKPDVYLPRFGLAFEMPKEFSAIKYYGRGPSANYNDRRTASFIGEYESTPETEFVPYPRTQHNGNHEEVRYLQLSSPSTSLFIKSTDPFSFTVLPWTEQELSKARHPYQLPESDKVAVYIDKKTTGLGGLSCGQGAPLKPDRANSAPQHISFSFYPIKK